MFALFAWVAAQLLPFFSLSRDAVRYIMQSEDGCVFVAIMRPNRVRFAAGGLLSAGLTNAQVAERLFISPRTVNGHLTSVYHKLGVSSRSAATRCAVEHGLA